MNCVSNCVENSFPRTTHVYSRDFFVRVADPNLRSFSSCAGRQRCLRETVGSIYSMFANSLSHIGHGCGCSGKPDIWRGRIIARIADTVLAVLSEIIVNTVRVIFAVLGLIYPGILLQKDRELRQDRAPLPKDGVNYQSTGVRPSAIAAANASDRQVALNERSDVRPTDAISARLANISADLRGIDAAVAANASATPAATATSATPAAPAADAPAVASASTSVTEAAPAAASVATADSATVTANAAATTTTVANATPGAVTAPASTRWNFWPFNRSAAAAPAAPALTPVDASASPEAQIAAARTATAVALKA